MSDNDWATTAQAQVAHLEMVSTINAAQTAQAPGSGRSESVHTTVGARRASDASALQLKDELRLAKSQIAALQKAAQQSKIDADRKDAQIQQLIAKYDKEVATSRELQSALKAAEVQLGILKKEISVIQHNMASKQGSKDDPEAKVRSLKEQLDKAQDEILGLKSQQSGDKPQQEITRLTDENKALQRQRSEFVACLRKQNKLIDILKRQCLHLEAAKMLQLTESEFTSALEGRSA